MNFKIGLVNLVNDMDTPLGILSIATYLKHKLRNEDIQVGIIDSNLDNPLKIIKKGSFDIIGISAMTVYFNKAKKLAEKIHAFDNNILIVIGGVHISTHAESFCKEFDVAVIGEGEETFAELVSTYINNIKNKANINYSRIKGIKYWEDGKIIQTEKRDLINPLDSIPIPDRSYINTKRYFKSGINRSVDGKYVKAATMMTGRGCPFKCIFCSTTLFWEKVRLFSVKRFADEVEYLYNKFNIKVISIWDDLFGITKQRIKDILEEFEKRNLLGRISFITMFKADLIDDEMCILLKKLGVCALNFGFESGSEKILSYLKKNKLKVTDIKNAINICKKYNIKVMGSLMMGSPGETVADFKKTLDLIEFMKEKKIEGAWIFVTSPFPGTELWDYGVKQGLIDKNFDFDYSSHYNTKKPIFLDSSVSLEDFQKYFKIAFKNLAYFSRDSWQNRAKRAVSDPVGFVKKIYTLIFLYSAFPIIVKKIKNKIKYMINYNFGIEKVFNKKKWK